MMEPGPRCPRCLTNKKELEHVKECLKLCEEEKKALQAKADRISSLNVQYKEYFFNRSQCVTAVKLRDEASQLYEQSLRNMELFVENAKDYSQLKEEKQETDGKILSLRNQLEEKDKENINLKFVATQLGHENCTLRNEVDKLRKEVSQLCKLSARRSSCGSYRSKKSLRAIRFAKKLLRLGKLGDKDRNWLKSIIGEEEEEEEEEEESDEDDNVGGKEDKDDNAGDKDDFKKTSKNAIPAAPEHVENQVFHFSINVLSPDEGLGLSPPVVQQSNPPDHDSACNVFTATEESEQQDDCMDIQFGKIVVHGNLERAGKKEVEPIDSFGSVEDCAVVKYSNCKHAVKEFSKSMDARNIGCAGKREDPADDFVSAQNCEIVDNSKSTVKESNCVSVVELSENQTDVMEDNNFGSVVEHSDNESVVGYAGRRKEEEKEQQQQQPVNDYVSAENCDIMEDCKGAVEEDSCGRLCEFSENKMEDDSFDCVVEHSETETCAVDHEKDEQLDDDLFGDQSGIDNAVSSSSEMSAYKTFHSKDCSVVTSNSVLCNKMKNSRCVRSDSVDDIERHPSQKKRRKFTKMKNEQVAKKALRKKEKRNEQNTRHQRKKETPEKKLRKKKLKTTFITNLSVKNVVIRLEKGNNNEDCSTNSMDVNWLVRQLRDLSSEAKKNKKSVHKIRKQPKKCTRERRMQKKSSKRKCKRKPNKVLSPAAKSSWLITEIPVESSCAVDDMADLSPVLMDTCSEDNPIRTRRKTKQIFKSNRKKTCIKECMKKQKTLSERIKCSWNVTECPVLPVLDTDNAQDRNEILMSVLKQLNDHVPLKTSLIEAQSSAMPCHTSVHAQPLASCQTLLDQSQVALCEVSGQREFSSESKSLVSLSQSSVPSSQPQSFGLSESLIQLQSSAPCEALVQLQSSSSCRTLLDQSQLAPCEVLGQTQSSSASQSSVQSQRAVPCEPSSQPQSFTALSELSIQSLSSASCQVSLVQSQLAPCDVSGQTQLSGASQALIQSQLSVPCEPSSQPQSFTALSEPLIQSQPSVPCQTEVQSQQSSPHHASWSDSFAQFGVDKTMGHDISPVRGMEVDTALSEVVVDVDRSKMADENSEEEIAVSSQTHCSSSNTLKEDLHDFVLYENLIGSSTYLPLDKECPEEEDATEKSLHIRKTTLPVCDSDVSEAEDGRKLEQMQSNQDEGHLTDHDYYSGSSDVGDEGESDTVDLESEQPAAHRRHNLKRKYTAICESNQTEQSITESQTADQPSASKVIKTDSKETEFSGSSDNMDAPLDYVFSDTFDHFDIENMPILLQEDVVTSNFDNLTDDDKMVSPSSGMFETAFGGGERSDVEKTIEIMTEINGADLLMISTSQEDAVTAEPKVQDLEPIIAGGKAKEIAFTTAETCSRNNLPDRLNKKPDASSSSAQRNIQTRSMAKQVSRGKRCAVTEDRLRVSRGKNCNRKTVQPELLSREGNTEIRRLTRSLARSTHSRPSTRSSTGDSLNCRENISRRETRSNANVCSDVLKRINRDVSRILTKARNVKRVNPSVLNSFKLGIDMKTDFIESDSEIVPVTEGMEAGNSDRQTDIISHSVNATENIFQMDVVDVGENQTQQMSMPLLDRCDFQDTMSPKMDIIIVSHTKECETSTDIKGVVENQTQPPSMPLLDDGCDNLGNMSPGCMVNTADVSLDEGCGGGVVDSESQLLGTSLLDHFHNYVNNEVTVGGAVGSNVLSSMDVCSNGVKQDGESLIILKANAAVCSEEGSLDTQGKNFSGSSKTCTDDARRPCEAKGSLQKQELSSALDVISGGEHFSIKSNLLRTGEQHGSTKSGNTSVTTEVMLRNQSILNGWLDSAAEISGPSETDSEEDIFRLSTDLGSSSNKVSNKLSNMRLIASEDSGTSYKTERSNITNVKGNLNKSQSCNGTKKNNLSETDKSESSQSVKILSKQQSVKQNLCEDNFKIMNSEISLQIVSNSDNTQNESSHSHSTKTCCHDVGSVSPHLKRSLSKEQSASLENKTPNVDKLPNEGRDDKHKHDQFPHDRNGFDIIASGTASSCISTDELLYVDLAVSNSDTDLESISESVINHSDDVTSKASEDVTKDLCSTQSKEIYLTKGDLKKTCNHAEKNYVPTVVSNTELADSEKMVCIDLTESSSDTDLANNISKIVDEVRSNVTMEISKDVALLNSGESSEMCPTIGMLKNTCNPISVERNYIPTTSNDELKNTVPKNDKNLSSSNQSNKSSVGKGNVKQKKSLATLRATDNNMKKESVCLRSSEKRRKTAEGSVLCKSSDEELNKIFSEFRCPSLITPFSNGTEKTVTSCVVSQDRTEVFKRPGSVTRRVRCPTPAIYQSENDSESDHSVNDKYNLQTYKKVKQEVSDDDSDSSTVSILRSGTCRVYKVYEHKRVDSSVKNTVKSEKLDIINTDSKIKIEIVEEQADKATDIAKVTKNLSPSSEPIIQNKHSLPQVILRTGTVSGRKIKIKNNKLENENRAADVKSIKTRTDTPRMSFVDKKLNEQISLLTKKFKIQQPTVDNKLSSGAGQQVTIKMDVDNQPSLAEICEYNAPVTKIKQQTLSEVHDVHDAKRMTVDNKTLGEVSQLTQMGNTESSAMFSGNGLACPEINKCFNFYSADSFFANEEVVQSDNADKFSEIFSDDVPSTCGGEENDSDSVDIEQLSKYILPCDTNVLAKAFEFHRSDICQPREFVLQTRNKKHSDTKKAKDSAKSIKAELVKLVDCSREELRTVMHSIKGYGKHTIVDGIVLVLLDDPVVTLTMCDMRKQSVNRLRLPPLVSQKKQLLLYLVKQLIDDEEFKNDFFTLVCSRIIKELFSTKSESIVTSASLVQFYTLLCRMIGNITQVKILIYDLLCSLKNRCHTLILEVLLMWPNVIIPASEVPSIKKSQVIHMVIIHCIMNHSLKTDTPLMRVVALKNYLKAQYGYEMGQYTSDQILQILINRLTEKDCKFAFTLLCKRSGTEWNHTKAVPALLKALQNSWHSNEVAARCAISLLGIICRILPASSQNIINNTFEVLKSYLLKMKGSPCLKEEIVIALAHMFRLDKKLCVEVLTEWKPENGSISVRVLQCLKPLICDRRPGLWNVYFSTMEELKSAEESTEDLIQECTEAVNNLLSNKKKSK